MINMKKKSRYLRIAFTLAILSMCMNLCSGVVIAGELNLAEAGILQFLSGTFNYNNKSYVVRGEYIAKASDYMCRDDISLTNEDKETAISVFYRRMEEGINQGYLKEVDTNQDVQPDNVEVNQEVHPDGMEANLDELKENQETVVDDIQEDVKDDDEIMNSETESTINNLVQELIEDQSNDKNNVLQEDNELTYEENSREQLEQIQENGEIQTKNMIKDTGFSNEPMKKFTVCIIIAYLSTMITTIILKLTARSYEQS